MWQVRLVSGPGLAVTNGDLIVTVKHPVMQGCAADVQFESSSSLD